MHRRSPRTDLTPDSIADANRAAAVAARQELFSHASQSPVNASVANRPRWSVPLIAKLEIDVAVSPLLIMT